MTTAASVLLSETELAFEAIYKDFFKLSLVSSDLTATKASFKTKLESLQMNTIEVENYLGSLASYVSVASNIFQVGSSLDRFMASEKTFIQSFEGLSNIDFNPGFALDPRNAKFNEWRVLSAAASVALKLNPAGTYAFFNDPSTPRNFATYLVAAIDVSTRIKGETAITLPTIGPITLPTIGPITLPTGFGR